MFLAALDVLISYLSNGGANEGFLINFGRSSIYLRARVAAKVDKSRG